jgi:hypothetical protein
MIMVQDHCVQRLVARMTVSSLDAIGKLIIAGSDKSIYLMYIA